MDIAGGFDQSDSRGFIRVNALRLKAHRLILRRAGAEEPARGADSPVSKNAGR
jgi:hypothetical protein